VAGMGSPLPRIIPAQTPMLSLLPCKPLLPLPSSSPKQVNILQIDLDDMLLAGVN